MDKNKIIKYFPILLVIPVLLLIVFNLNFNKDFVNAVNKVLLLTDNEVEETEKYTIEEVKMLAASLKVKENWDEDIKIIPLTCKVNINRMIKLIYMDGEEQLGFKYVYYRKPAGDLLFPSKKGYDFVEWTNVDDEVVTKDTVIATDEDYYVYANWVKHVSTLTVDPAQGTWESSTEKQTFKLEYEETKDIPDPTRVGYDFTGWKVEGEASKLEDRVFTMGYENTTITAQWSPKKYTLHYDVNQGAAVNPTSKEIIYTKEYGQLPTTSRTGYTFAGWYTDRNGGTKVNEHTVHNVTNDVTIYAHWDNTPPTEPKFTISYKNNSGKDEGMLPRTDGATETITVTITSSDKEETYPTSFNLVCSGGGLCKNGNATISGPTISNGTAVYTITAKKMGVGLLKATVNDTPGLDNHNSTVIYVYGPDGKLSEDAKYDVYSFDSGWVGELEGCYISDFEMTVQFGSGHYNGGNNDNMKVTGKTKSGKEVDLFYYEGNMEGNLHKSTLDKLNEYYKNNPNDPIIDIKFYTYSPHDGCTPAATIHYSVKYTFDKKLLNE